MICRMSEQEQPDVAAWFADRGFGVSVSGTVYANRARRLLWGRKRLAASREYHFWVDLLAVDGRLIQRGYGGGKTKDEALERARQRYRQEQEGGQEPGTPHLL